jgi:hypothetical protein
MQLSENQTVNSVLHTTNYDVNYNWLFFSPLHLYKKVQRAFLFSEL